MGVDLIGHGDFSVNWTGWRALLDLAIEFDWKPAGTIPNLTREELSNSDWERQGYTTNDFQLVTDEDANAISAALRKALASPDHPYVRQHVRFGYNSITAALRSLQSGRS